jgi:protein FAM50
MGDFGANFHRPESGIHTVEGNVAGSRAAELSKKRQKDQLAFEAKKRQLELQVQQATTTVQKFASQTAWSKQEQHFQAQTIGLVSAEEFKRAAARMHGNADGRDDILDGNNEKDSGKGGNATANDKEAERLEREKKKKRKEKRRMLSKLSFVGDEEENGFLPPDKDNNDENMERIKPKKSFKDPTIDTSFLPDKQREEDEKRQRMILEQEWMERQEAMKQETLEIVYSYWDGSGHRRTVQCRKGDTIGQFLELVRQDLAREFRELSNIASDALVYVKEDLIIPHDFTFYDLIVTKARGKSGPLFHFDVHDDIRIGALDSRIEKDESHPGKVIERRWYDRNKHIFPASRWEIFDPSKEYGTYTIHGQEARGND